MEETSTKTVIKAKVAKVISPEQIVINKGKSDGIKIGMVFLVYRLGEEIKDPETGKSLGELELIVGRGRAAHVQEHMTTIYSDDSASNMILFPSNTIPKINGCFDFPAINDLVKSI